MQPFAQRPLSVSYSIFEETTYVRIYADESGTHAENWLVIGMLFVPDHGHLHSSLCAVKERERYFNLGPRRAKYKEIHFSGLKSPRDIAVSRAWIDCFLSSTAVFRSVVVDWSRFEGRYFGDPFEQESLKKRRAYKKWAEMLLQPELANITGATFYLDRLRVLHGHDMIVSLKDRFQRTRYGEQLSRPRIRELQATESWKDANQCLQLCDLLVGAIHQSLVPSGRKAKLEVKGTCTMNSRPTGSRAQRHRIGEGTTRMCASTLRSSVSGSGSQPTPQTKIPRRWAGCQRRSGSPPNPRPAPCLGNTKVIHRLPTCQPDARLP